MANHVYKIPQEAYLGLIERDPLPLIGTQYSPRGSNPGDAYTLWVNAGGSLYLGPNPVVSGGAINHNSLAGLQGGQASQYYHLNAAQHTGLTGLTNTFIPYMTAASGVLADTALEWDAANGWLGVGITPTVPYHFGNGDLKIEGATGTLYWDDSKQALIHGATSYTQPYSTYDVQGNTTLVMSTGAGAIGTNTPFCGLLFEKNLSAAGYFHTTLAWVNSAIVADEKRLAQMSIKTRSATNVGRLLWYINGGSGVTEVMDLYHDEVEFTPAVTCLDNITLDGELRFGGTDSTIEDPGAGQLEATCASGFGINKTPTCAGIDVSGASLFDDDVTFNDGTRELFWDCSAARLYMLNVSAEGALNIGSGNSASSSTYAQIRLGYINSQNYAHAIKTRHSNGTATGNAFDFYLWRSGVDGVGDLGTLRGMTIDAGAGVLIDDSMLFGYSDAYFTNPAAGQLEATCASGFGINKTPTCAGIDVSGASLFDNDVTFDDGVRSLTWDASEACLTIRDANGVAFQIDGRSGVFGYLHPQNPFIGSLYQGDIHNALYAANKRFTVTLTNFTNVNVSYLFGESFEMYDYNKIAAGTTATILIDMDDKGETNSVIYPYGYIYLTFFSPDGTGSDNLTISGRMEDKNGSWYDMTGVIQETDEHKVRWRLTMPRKPYGRTIEISIQTGALATAAGLVNVEWYMTRPAGRPFPALSGNRTNFNYYNMYWKDDSYNTTVEIGNSGYLKLSNYLDVGSSPSAASTGDIAGSDGTRELFWDCSAARLYMLNTSAAGALSIGSGNSATLSTYAQIRLGWLNTQNYAHAIKTRHQGGAATGNAIDFYLWQHGVDGSGDIGTLRGMTIDAGAGVLIDDSMLFGYSDAYFTNPAADQLEITAASGVGINKTPTCAGIDVSGESLFDSTVGITGVLTCADDITATGTVQGAGLCATGLGSGVLPYANASGCMTDSPLSTNGSNVDLDGGDFVINYSGTNPSHDVRWYVKNTDGVTDSVADGDDLGGLIWFGYYDPGGGGDPGWLNAAHIHASVDGTPGSGDMPGKLSFGITPDGSGTLEYPVDIQQYGGSGGLECVVNDTGAADHRFRVEGDTEANLICTDPANDRVGIGTAAPNSLLEVLEGDLTIHSTSNDAVDHELHFMKDRASAGVQASDELGAIYFKGWNGTDANYENYVAITGYVNDATDDAEYGGFKLSVLYNSSLEDFIQFKKTGAQYEWWINECG